MDSPKLYAELRDFIRTRLYREGGFQNLVKKRQQQYADTLGREISYEYAEEEVICNSLGDILTSERVMDELAGTHRTLFARIWRLVKEFFKKIFQRMRSMDGDFAYKTTEQRVVEKALLTEHRRLEDLFVKALRDASATSRATLAIARNDADGAAAADELDGIKFSLMEDIPLGESVDKVLSMSNEKAIENKEAGNFVSISKNTPDIILNNVEDAEDLEIIMRFDSFYLAARHDGALKGNYHNFGAIMKELPEIISHPLAIVRMNNKRLNILASVPTAKGDNTTASIELNTVKDVNSKYSKYNMIVTLVPSKDNYMRNNLLNNGVKVEYEKEDLPQVNHQLHEWLAIINERSSTPIIPDPAEKSNPSDEKSLEKGKWSLNDSRLDNRGENGYTYTEEQYNRFGWAREAKGLTKNELDDLYSKIKEKASLQSFKRSSSGEFIIEVNDDPHKTLGVDNVFVFVTGTKNNFTVRRVVRFDVQTETEMESIKEALYEGRTCSDTYLAILKKEGLAREYRRKDSPTFVAYREGRSNGETSRRTDTYNRGRKKYGSGYSLVVGDDGEVTETAPWERKTVKESLTEKFSLRDTLAREQLSAMFYEMAASPVEREIVEKYKAEIVDIDAKIDERRRILERLKEIEGKSGFGGERERLEGRLKGVNAYITGRDRRLFELESARPFKEMVERYDAELAKKREAAPKALSNSRYAYVSRGKYNELIAKERGGKVYTQKDAQVIEDAIPGFDKLSRRKKNIIVDELWQGMNAAQTDEEREGVIRSVGDMIFEELSQSVKLENPEYAEIEQTLLYLSGYVQRLTFSDEMKGEIRHRLDEAGTKSFMGRWQNKKSDVFC